MPELTHSHETHHSQEHNIQTDTNFIGKIGQKIWDNRMIIVLLIAIFLIAFGIRGHLLRYEYLFEFDSFYHARLVEDLVLQGHFSNPDPLAYYQLPNGMQPQVMSLYHIVSAFLYEIVAFGQPFNKELFMWTIQFFPVVFGSIISILLYFLGKEVFNKKVGIIMAFVGAVTPAFAYRTMAGAQGDNAFGFIWFVLGFIFFVRAVKTNTLDKKSVINIVLAGIMFGLMSMSWDMYLLIPLIVIFYSIFAIVIIASKERAHTHETDLTQNHAFVFAVKVIIAMLIFHVMCYAYGENWIGDALGYIGSPLKLGSDVTLFLVLGGALIASAVSIFYISKSNKETKSLFFSLALIGLYAGFIVMTFVFITVPDLQDRSTLASMVGEESVGNQFFGTKYNSLILFPWLAIILLPLSLWLFKREESHTSIIFFFWVIITLFMAWYKLKFTFVFGLAIAPAAAVVAYIILEGLKKFQIEKGLEAKVILVSLFVLLLFGVGASAKFFPDYVPYVDEHPEWQAAQQWIIESTPKDAKLFNWWDQGHILTFITERKVSTDNRNGSNEANVAMSKFIITTDTNEAYNIAANQIGADYVVLDSSMITEAGTFEYYVANKVDSSLVQKYYQGVVRVLNCQDTDTNTPSVTCEGNTISRAEWNKLADKWKSTPDDFQNGSEPVFYYKSHDQLIIINQALNNTNVIKVWMNSEETKDYYEDAYTKLGIKILKIKR